MCTYNLSVKNISVEICKLYSALEIQKSDQRECWETKDKSREDEIQLRRMKIRIDE